MAIFNIHAGHNRAGAVACGAVGILDESKEAREVKNRVITMLRAQGHTVYDCTEDNGTSQSDVLTKIVKKCNAHKVDLDVSIHFNAGGGNGTEVLVYNTTGKSKTYADRTVQSIAELGFTNRGVKTRTDLYFLKKTVSPAMLIECCFVDSQTDANLYNPDKMAAAIVKGITGVAGTVQTTSSTSQSATSSVDLVELGYAHAKNFAGVERSYSLQKAKGMVLQQGINLDYNAGLALDGIVGTKSKKALGSHYVKKSETQFMVTAAEILMYLNGINPNGVECPGTYGNGLVKAAKTKFGGDGTRISASNFLTLIQ